ncbi:MAG TPA: DUF881 domain-containing protein [Dermatophilaceae bacterium]|nr:DUF881 domain-containing protein [Dermatophilaceae bacterium]
MVEHPAESQRERAPDPEPDAAGPAPEDSAWRRLLLAGQGTRASLLAAALALLLGFALATQVQQTRGQTLQTLRQTDLVGILDNLNANAARLDDEARNLLVSRDRLVSGTQGGEAAVRAAQEQLDALGILAGTVAVAGPGIRMTITDPSGKVTSALLLDAIQELRDAGAESIQLGPARVVASSYVASAAGGLSVDGQRLQSPYRLVAIGASQTLASAMSIPGGIIETVRQQGATISVTPSESLRIDALHTPKTPRYARPQPAPTAK